MSLAIISLLGKFVLAIITLFTVIILSRRNGVLSRDKQTLVGKITSTKNLGMIMAKELEKVDSKYKTLFYKISRAYSADDYNAIVHEIYETVSPIAAPTASEVQTTSRETLLPTKSGPRK